MSATLQLQIAIWFTGMCVIGAFGYLGWLLWHIFWDWYDSVMQTKKRRINRASHVVGRDCFRDAKGIWK